MGIAERKSREKEGRRALILEKAKELILERGIPALSMQDIADAAELSKATLYLYFESKESLLSAILQEAAEIFMAYVGENMAPKDSGLEALKKLWTAHLELFGESNDIFVLMGILSYTYPGLNHLQREPGTERPLDGLFDLIQAALNRGKADGSLSPDLEPGKVTRTVMLIGTAIIENYGRVPREERNIDRAFEELRGVFELLLRGLAAEGSDRRLLTLSREGSGLRS